MNSARLLCWCAVALALSACATTHVIRTTAAPVKVSAPKYGETVVVRGGDTLYHLATTHGISVLDLAVWNDVAPPYTIYPGQRLRLYPRDRGSAPRGVASTVATRPATVSAMPRTTAPPRPALPRPAPTTPAATTPAAATTTPAATAPTGTTTPIPVANVPTWRWPTDGELVERYADGDPTRQGIDVAGRAGQPVLAAADGVVVYSGSGLVGYGELVIVKHNDNWLSAYGHNRARLVNEGQLVKAGQPIAEMGHTGAARDMLHFEIRYNGKPVDPLGYLPKR
jgi:lipoprotein NlpD